MFFVGAFFVLVLAIPVSRGLRRVDNHKSPSFLVIYQTYHSQPMVWYPLSLRQ
jgi:hypothetical protein